jgi:hypothetical protein
MPLKNNSAIGGDLMPSLIRKHAQAQNFVLKMLQDVVRKDKNSATRLKALDRLAVILEMVPKEAQAGFLGNADPSKITFAVPEEKLESTVSKMLAEAEKAEKKAAKAEESNADTVHQETGS